MVRLDARRRNATIDDPATRLSVRGDMQKGAVEDDQPWTTSNAPGLDDDGLPNDEIAIAENAIGARQDESQG